VLADGSTFVRWEEAARLVAEGRDLIEQRPGARSGEVPRALASRGWAEFLLSLDDEELGALESRGTDARWPDRTPGALRLLVERARQVCALPAASTPGESARPARRGETPRKRTQVEAFGRLVAPMASRATRVVDVGSGHGHLTRDMAERLTLPVVGLERDTALAGGARRLSSGASPTFTVTDVLQDGLPLSAGDCVIGLHACGELGDAMVASVARSRRVSLALVGCCLQKRRQPSRRPFCIATGLERDLDLPRALLGLSNLAASDDGVETTRAENLLGRERRLALHRLLSHQRPLRLGAEIEGLNRRAAHQDIHVLVARAFALRGQPPPSPDAIEEAVTWARAEHGRTRRLSVPRAVLARVLEVFVLLDRAAYLEQQGFAVQCGVLFPSSVSPRNLALLAQSGPCRR
jgi:hypothetical protein